MVLNRDANGAAKLTSETENEDEDEAAPESATGKHSLNIPLLFIVGLLLLIVGTFAALYFYSSWEKREVPSIEKIYLRNFLRDVNEDIANLKDSRDINSSRMIDVKEIIANLYKTPDSVDLKHFTNNYVSALYASKFTPTRPTLKDFMFYDKADILSNHRLRNDIFRYYDEVDKALADIESFETVHKNSFVPEFNSQYIKSRALVIFQKYYEDIDQETEPILDLWRARKDSPEFIRAENLLLQRLWFLDRTLQIEGDLLTKATQLKNSLIVELGE